MVRLRKHRKVLSGRNGAPVDIWHPTPGCCRAVSCASQGSATLRQCTRYTDETPFRAAPPPGYSGASPSYGVVKTTQRVLALFHVL